MESILERVRREGPLVGDGATGTMLIDRGLEPGDCPEAINLEHPEVLQEIASAYLEAGAEVIETNSFGGSPLKLAEYGLDDRTEEINRRAVQQVRQVAGDRAYVAASCGPCGRLLTPYGDTEPTEVAASFERQARALIEAGPDAICVETMIDLTEARLAVRAVKTLRPDMPVFATMTFDDTPRGFFTVMGVSVEQAVAGLVDEGADIIGTNCGNGIERMIAIAEEFAEHTRHPLIVQANAGLPENRSGTLVYPETPEFMAERAERLIDLGVAIVGGCCGTTPNHIRALRELVDRRRGRQ